LNNIERTRNQLKQEIRQEHARLERFNLLNKNNDQLKKDIISLTEQSENIRGKLIGLSNEDSKLIAQKSIVDEEKYISEYWKQELGTLLQSLEKLETDCSDRPRRKRPSQPINDQSINFLFDALGKTYIDVKSLVEQAKTILKQTIAPSSTVSSQFEVLNKNYTDFETKYNQAKERSQAHQSTLTQLENIEKRLKELKTEASGIETEIESLGDVSRNFSALLDRWFSLGNEISEQLSEQCNQLTVLSDGMIRATLDVNSDFSAILGHLQKIIKGTNLRFNKFEELITAITRSENIIEKWREVLLEIDNIIQFSDEHPRKDSSDVFNIKAHLSGSDIQKLSLKIKSQDWLELVLSPIKSLPNFEYMAREKDYIPFEDASAGQQATALLWALLNQDGPPLIIDQPEDDLDSQIIIEIVEHVWRAKGKRQLVFSSHNANLVVNGDAELVVCCDYRIVGEQSSGEIKIQGAIDINDVRMEITKVMEGGIEAFKLRKAKYGF